MRADPVKRDSERTPMTTITSDPAIGTRILVIAVALSAAACGGRVTQRVPLSSPLPKDLLASAAIARLIATQPLSELGDEILVAPDGHARLVIVGEALSALSADFPNYFGVELEQGDPSSTRPVMSLWECDTGSGISLAVTWAADSSAVRLTGCTKSFTRWRWRNDGGRFDFVYLPTSDTFHDVRSISSALRAAGSSDREERER